MSLNRTIAGIVRVAVRGIVLGCFALFPASLSLGQAPDSLRLDQVIGDVIRHNNRVAAARYMEAAAKAKVGPAGAWDDPMNWRSTTCLPALGCQEAFKTRQIIANARSTSHNMRPKSG
jgi:hypothetical protein